MDVVVVVVVGFSAVRVCAGGIMSLCCTYIYEYYYIM